MNTFAIHGTALLNAIKQVEHAMAHDDARPILASIRFEKLLGDTPGVRLVACDAYRIAWSDIHTDGTEAFEPFNVPRANIPMLKLWLRGINWPITLEVGDDHYLTVRLNKGSAISFLLQDGVYPDYQQVMPSGPQMAMALNPVYLAGLVKATPKGGLVIMRVHDPLRPVLFETYDGGEIIMPAKLGPEQAVNDFVPKEEK